MVSPVAASNDFSARLSSFFEKSQPVFGLPDRPHGGGAEQIHITVLKAAAVPFPGRFHDGRQDNRPPSSFAPTGIDAGSPPGSSGISPIAIPAGSSSVRPASPTRFGRRSALQ